MDKNWITWWLIVLFSALFTIIGLEIRIRGWKDE